MREEDFTLLYVRSIPVVCCAKKRSYFFAITRRIFSNGLSFLVLSRGWLRLLNMDDIRPSSQDYGEQIPGGLGQQTIILDPTVGPDVTINLGNRLEKIRKSKIFALEEGTLLDPSKKCSN